MTDDDSLGRSLTHIASKAEAHRWIDELPEDSTGFMVVTTGEDIRVRGFGEGRLSAMLGLAVWAEEYFKGMMFGPGCDHDGEGDA